MERNEPQRGTEPGTTGGRGTVKGYGPRGHVEAKSSVSLQTQNGLLREEHSEWTEEHMQRPCGGHEPTALEESPGGRMAGEGRASHVRETRSGAANSTSQSCCFYSVRNSSGRPLKGGALCKAVSTGSLWMLLRGKGAC